MFRFLDRIFKTIEIPFKWMERKAEKIGKKIEFWAPCVKTWFIMICIAWIPLFGQAAFVIWVWLGLPGGMPSDHGPVQNPYQAKDSEQAVSDLQI